MRAILEAFSGEFPPVRRTLGYHLGLLLVTGAMVLLPILYIGLIGCTGAFIVYFASHAPSLMSQIRSPLGIVFFVGGPLISGVILIFFMIKPLFAGSPKLGRQRFLEVGEEPLIYAFVGRIARAVGAPQPKRIAVDCDINASAGFGNGLAVLFGHDLVLTIGLPLAVGLTLPQLAGVLAHELGHFSQGMGMRLSFVVRSINAWFVRVVYERDTWDDALIEWSEEGGRLALIFILARFCVFLTRGILFLFMLIAHGLSCFLLRQMEFDADRYEARLAGSSAFEETERRLIGLAVANQSAVSILAQCWRKDRYPDDFPGLIVRRAEDLPAEALRLIEKQLKKASTGVFDTHPCLKHRLANARKENARGIFHMDRPGAVLFRNYRKLAQLASLDLYRQMIGKRVKRSDLHASGEW